MKHQGSKFPTEFTHSQAEKGGRQHQGGKRTALPSKTQVKRNSLGVCLILVGHGEFATH